MNQLEQLEELCTEFYQSGELDEVIESILEAADENNKYAEINGVTEKCVEFFSLLKALNYI